MCYHLSMSKNGKQPSSKLFSMFAAAILIGIFIIGAGVAIVFALNAEEPAVVRPSDPYRYIEDKPVIYLYPEKETEIEVKLGAPEKITVDYPDYNGGWKVLAQPDGTLTMNGSKYYALYYEAEFGELERAEDGFVLSRDEVEDFLDDKLEYLGLNYREREEFITYWASQLEQSPYVYVRFMTASEIEAQMPLEITPKPKTAIRVIMQFENLDEPIEVEEQRLEKAVRDGYTVVEWGGVNLGAKHEE